MSSFNRTILLGNLARDPDLRYTPKGAAVADFAIAVNRRWKTESGEEKDEVSFVDIVAFGRQAETIAQYVKKGDPLLLEGRLKQESWEDKTTHQKRSKLKVVLESFTFVGTRKAGDVPAEAPAPRRPAAGEQSRAAGTQQAAADAPSPEVDDDDVPYLNYAPQEA